MGRGRAVFASFCGNSLSACFACFAVRGPWLPLGFAPFVNFCRKSHPSAKICAGPACFVEIRAIRVSLPHPCRSVSIRGFCSQPSTFPTPSIRGCPSASLPSLTSVENPIHPPRSVPAPPASRKFAEFVSLFPIRADPCPSVVSALNPQPSTLNFPPLPSVVEGPAES
jgi:hypothetical protein